MKTVKAYMNYGRWIVDCPKHGNAGAMEVKETDTEYIPPCCYPQIIASIPMLKDGRFTHAPDKSARATGRRLAVQAGEVYQIVFPDKLEEIKTIMNNRPLNNRHWTNESIAALKKENKAHGHGVK